MLGVDNEKIKLFADVTMHMLMFVFDKYSKGLCLKATDYLDKLNLWFLANKLTLNTTKTCYVFSSKKMKI